MSNRGVVEEAYNNMFPYDDRGGYDPDFEKHNPEFTKAFYEGKLREYKEEQENDIKLAQKAYDERKDAELKIFEEKFGKHQIQYQDTLELDILIKLEGMKITEQQYRIIVHLFPAFLNSYEENGGFQPGLLRECLLEKVDLPDQERKDLLSKIKEVVSLNFASLCQNELEML
jgi:hypothetical protein